ncbi:MAG: hypothetical protein PUP91_11675 [Rhizonema sp. PD37]|nr:hypothetical protein [Rhizonema sp. PD37]
MKFLPEKLIVSLLVTLISAAGTLGSALISQNQKSPSEVKPSATPISIISNHPTDSECNKALNTKVCVAHVTVQINSDEPQEIKNNERIPLKAGDRLRLVDLYYCILPEVTVNKVEVKGYLFKNGVESYNDGLLTPSNFPINTGCHNVNNFKKTWKVEPGEHEVSIPIIKYDGSNRIVDKNFYLNLDVGQ